MATQQELSRQAWNKWLRTRESFPEHRIRTVIGILKLDACEYEEGRGHGPAAFANFAFYRAGRAELAGMDLDGATATGIRKVAAVEALLAKHGQAGLLRDDAASIVEAVWAGVTRRAAAPAPPATPMQAAPHAATAGAEPVAVCERCPRPGLAMPAGAFVECGTKVLCAQCYATSDAPAPGSTVAHFATGGTDVPPTYRAAVAVPPAEYAATTEGKIAEKLRAWVELWRQSSTRVTDLLAGRLVMSFMTQRGAMPPDGFLPGSLKHLTKPENKAKYAEALQLYKDTADLVHDLLDETEMERRVEGVFDKLLPGARNTRGKLTKGAIEIVIAVDDVEPQWPHVDILTPGKLQVLVYLNGVQVATQLARYAGDPVEWAERTYAADGDGIGPDKTWREQVGELAQLAAVTAESGTERVVVTPAVVGPVPAGTVQAIASSDAVHFGPASTGLRFLLVFVVAASETSMDQQEVPLQRAGPDTLAMLGLVGQLVLPHVRQEMRAPFFERRRKGYQQDFDKEAWPRRATHRPIFSPSQWARLLSINFTASQGEKWNLFREELRRAADAYRHQNHLPRQPHRQVRIIPVGAQQHHSATMDGVSVERLLHGTYANGDRMVRWSSAEVVTGKEKVFAHKFEEGEVGRVDSGVATVTPSDGERPFMIGPGDVVQFAAGFGCTFTVHETIVKTIVYLTEKGAIDYDTTKITCDKCGNALGANEAWYREKEGKGEDWCKHCFTTQHDVRYFVRQERGTPTGFAARPHGKGGQKKALARMDCSREQTLGKKARR